MPTTDRTASRTPDRAAATAAGLLLAGTAAGAVSGLLHPHREAPNDHAHVFAEYASSRDWLAVHVLQYASAVTVVAGLLAVVGLVVRPAGRTLLDRLAAASATVTAALVAVNMAVDGVALGQAVRALSAAPPADRTARFAAVEAVRWLEWGANAFFVLQLGVTVVLCALLVGLRTPRGRSGAALGLASGTLLVVNGYGVAAHGFAPTRLPLVATALFLGFAAGVLRLRPASDGVRTGDPVPAPAD